MTHRINIGYSKELGITMKTSRKLSVALMMLSFLALGGCGNSALFSCENDLKSTVPSPDGKYAAGVLSVQCGATTADATWVLLKDSKDGFDYERDKVAVFEGSAVALSWKDESLQVVYHEAKPYKMDPSAKGVSIKYQNKKLAP